MECRSDLRMIRMLKTQNLTTDNTYKTDLHGSKIDSDLII